MINIEQNDPEASYRRGYQQGAFDALAAADPVAALPPPPQAATLNAATATSDSEMSALLCLL